MTVSGDFGVIIKLLRLDFKHAVVLYIPNSFRYATCLRQPSACI